MNVRLMFWKRNITVSMVQSSKHILLSIHVLFLGTLSCTSTEAFTLTWTWRLCARWTLYWINRTVYSVRSRMNTLTSSVLWGWVDWHCCPTRSLFVNRIMISRERERVMTGLIGKSQRIWGNKWKWWVSLIVRNEWEVDSYSIVYSYQSR